MTRLPADASPDPNPYAPPETSAVGPRAEPLAPGDSEFRIFKHWERLRLLYNLILTVETVAILATHGIWWGQWASLVVGIPLLAFAANVCFCAGPVFHCYAAMVGIRGRMVATVIFWPGMLVAMALAYGSIAMMTMTAFPD